MKTLNRLAMLSLMVCGLVLSSNVRANEEESFDASTVEAPQPAEDTTSSWTGSTEETTPDTGTTTDYDSADSGYEY